MSEAGTRVRRTRTGMWTRAVVAGAAVSGLVLVSGALLVPVHAEESTAVTVTAREQDADIDSAPFPELSVTVSQTKELVDQGLLISYSGGIGGSEQPGSTGGKNFLQIMQCWGDVTEPGPDGEPVVGPDRTTCLYGGTLQPGSRRDATRGQGDTIAPQDYRYSSPASGFIAPARTSIPFRSAVGDDIADIADGTDDAIIGRFVPGVNVNANQYLARDTTNEVPWTGFGADGSGQAKFEVQTARRAPGLGCGATKEQSDGTRAPASCWIVVVPRGEADSGFANVSGSGLHWDQWKHRVAVRIGFKPVESRCPIGAAEIPIAGSEVAAQAVGSWQPALCGRDASKVYSLLTGPESDAVYSAHTVSGAALALTSRAAEAEDVTSVAYAPIALSGISIAFAVDAKPDSQTAPEDVLSRSGLPMEDLRLTPRLVAKLLTNSYTWSVPAYADISHLGSNPGTLISDPDFQAINDDEWSYQTGVTGPGVSDVLVPRGRSDAAVALWEYVMADADARAFLEGQPDPWGMKVNPWYSINTTVNPVGEAMVLPRENFPKADPIERAPRADGDPNSGSANLVDWRPFSHDLDGGAYDVLRGDALVLGSWDPNRVPPRWETRPRDLGGDQKVLGLTSTSAAAKYQVFEAELRNAAGQFVAPGVEGMLAAAAAMTPSAEAASVLRLDHTSAPAKAASTAYPLTMPVYAAVDPAKQDAATREAYAGFIEYAVSESAQTLGVLDGQLPAGYAPLPASWRTDAAGVVATLRGQASTPPAPTAEYDGTGTGGMAWPGGGSAPLAGSAPATDVVGQPAAAGQAAGPLATRPTAADVDLGAYPAIVPASVAAGAVAMAATLFLSRRRFVRAP